MWPSIRYERVQFLVEDNTTHSSPELHDCRCSSCPSGTQLPQRRIQCFQHSRLQRAHYTHFQVAKIYHRNSSIKSGTAIWGQWLEQMEEKPWVPAQEGHSAYCDGRLRPKQARIHVGSTSFITLTLEIHIRLFPHEHLKYFMNVNISKNRKEEHSSEEAEIFIRL